MRGLLVAFNFYVRLNIEMPLWKIWERPVKNNRQRPPRKSLSDVASEIAAEKELKNKTELAAAKAEVLRIADNEKRLTDEEYDMIVLELRWNSWNNIERAMDIIRSVRERPANGGRRRTRRRTRRRCN